MEVDFEAMTNSGQPAGGPLNAALAPLFTQMMQAMTGQAPPPRQPTQACHTLQMLQLRSACKCPVEMH